MNVKDKTMNDAPCDHMLELVMPFCNLGLHFPLDCPGCKSYRNDREEMNQRRKMLWQSALMGALSDNN
jgi:hypothetical protein